MDWFSRATVVWNPAVVMRSSGMVTNVSPFNVPHYPTSRKRNVYMSQHLKMSVEHFNFGVGVHASCIRVHVPSELTGMDQIVRVQGFVSKGFIKMVMDIVYHSLNNVFHQQFGMDNHVVLVVIVPQEHILVVYHASHMYHARMDIHGVLNI